MYSAPDRTPEEIAAAYTKMATRPPGESGTPKAVETTPCTRRGADCLQTRLELGQVQGAYQAERVLREKAEEALHDLQTKFILAGGVTEDVRHKELLVKLQGIHTGMQNNIENLEAEAGDLRKRVRFLEGVLEEFDHGFAAASWTEFEPPVKDPDAVARDWAMLTGGDGTQL